MENIKIKQFIQDVSLADGETGAIAASLRKIVLRLDKAIKEEIKYGGIVFEKDERIFCGIFVRKNHISLEFDRGAELKDEDEFLERGGRQRRHLKICRKDDIMNKKAGCYIKQCYDLEKLQEEPACKK